MINGYALTLNQVNLLQRKLWSDETAFYCTTDINGDWYIAAFGDDYERIANTEYAWVLDLPTRDFEPNIVIL